MAYPELMVKPMREEVTRLGAVELRTPQDVDRVVAESGTVLVFVNSICGCAAGAARPALATALKHKVHPDTVATVFAGADVEATAHLRSLIREYPPSSPSAALFKGGKLVYMLQRGDIEGRDPGTIARSLTAAFDVHCAKK